MKRTTAEFAQVLDRLHLPKAGRALVERIRASEPARRVNGATSVSGRFPSYKMGMSIQYESRSEAAAISLYEADPQIEEFYDQPARLQIEREQPGVSARTFSHTPDFFVVRRTATGYELVFEEWHARNRMTRLAEEDPLRFSSDGTMWHDVLIEPYLAHLGLGYQLRLIENLDPKIVRNTELLGDFAETRHEIKGTLREKAVAAVIARPGCTLEELIAHLSMGVDDAFALIAQHVVWCDLGAALLTNHAGVRLYPDVQIAQLVSGPPLPVARGTVDCSTGATVQWAATAYEIAQVSDTSVWLTAPGDSKKLSRDTFDAWVLAGDITGVSDGRASLAKLLSGASPKALSVAQARLDRVAAFADGARRPLSRTHRRWLDAAAASTHIAGHALPGLLDRSCRRGNRAARIAAEGETLAESVIDEFIMQPEQRAVSIAYSLYAHRAKLEGVAAMKRTAFYRRVKRRSAASVARAQWGGKAANALALPRQGVFSNTGDRVFARVHIDHTEFDVALIDSGGTDELGRAWCTLARDAYSGRILAFVLLYDTPSSRSLQLVLREMVRKWHRLPGTIIFDHGSDSMSASFETTCSVYGTNLEHRPAGDPRYGAPVEAMFAKLNRDLLWNLRGNTKIRKNVRKMSPQSDPGKNAVWTLADLHAEIEQYVAWHDEQPNTALGGTPKALHEQSLALAGSRTSTQISYDVAFRALTAFPGPRRGGRATIDRTGVTINGLTYWSKAFQAVGMEGRSVDVRYEPFDARVAYVKIDEAWHEVHCGLRGFEGRTETEVRLATQELRRQLRQRPSQEELAAYLATMQLREADLAAAKNERERAAARAARKATEQQDLVMRIHLATGEDEPALQAIDAPSAIDLSEMAAGFDKPSRDEIADMAHSR